MPITTDELKQLIGPGQLVATAGGRSKFKILSVDKDRVKIKSNAAKKPATLTIVQLSAIVDQLAYVEAALVKGTSINRAVAEALETFGLFQSQTESHLLGLAREIRERQLLDPGGTVFEEQVRSSLALSAKERKKRLHKAPRIPKQVRITICSFVRNPDVVAEVLSRAAGVCEKCNGPAPFKRKSDGTPFLEVHHRIRLADGGEDTVQNAIALCPNCHRETHWG